MATRSAPRQSVVNDRDPAVSRECTMALRCSMLGHVAGSTHHHNQGLDFAVCHHCGIDLLRAEDGDWTQVPKGFGIVWREFGREGDAASVAARMARMTPPRRRAPRTARPARRRDRRGAPLSGGATMLGLLANLGELIADDSAHDGADILSGRQHVICLPNTASR